MQTTPGPERDRELVMLVEAALLTAREYEQNGQPANAALAYAQALFFRDCLATRSRSARFRTRRVQKMIAEVEEALRN